MKKTLLFLVLAMFVSAGFAQSKFTEIVGPNKDLMLKHTFIHPNHISPIYGSVIGQKSYEFSIIGTTWNDLQTYNYGNVMQRMWAFPDGTIGSTWISAGEDNEPERSAGYNYFNGSEWGEPIPHMGPEDRMGGPSYAPWGPEGEIIALYRYIVGEGPIYFYRREVKGEGDWEEIELLPPSGISITWHTMITSGDNNEHIHLLARTYDEPYMDQDNALLYYRSSDGGESWDIYEEIIEGLDIDYFPTTAPLSYAWANPVGNTIAFTYGFDEWGGRLFKSNDNGDSWEVSDVFTTPFDPFDPPYDTDKFGCGIGTSACAIDSEGKVHVAFPRMAKIFTEGSASWFPYTDGMIYWNEDMDPLDTTIISTTTMEYLEEGGNLIGWILGDETYQIPPDQPNYGNSLCGFPQFSLDADDNMFVAYSSVAPGYSNGIFDFRHIIINSSFDGGQTWEGQKDLNTETIFIFSECAFPMMAPIIGDYVQVTYQEDSEPGINQWLNNHQPIENKIHHMQIEKDIFVDIPKNRIDFTFELSDCYPNPATNQTMLQLRLEQNTEVSIHIVNIMGQSVKTFPVTEMKSGNNPINIDVSKMTAGVYYCSVEVGQHTMTKKFIVQK